MTGFVVGTAWKGVGVVERERAAALRRGAVLRSERAVKASMVTDGMVGITQTTTNVDVDVVQQP